MKNIALSHCQRAALFIGAILLLVSTRPASAQIQDITWTLGPNYPSSIKAGASGVIGDTLVYAGGTPIPALNGSNDSNRTYGIPLGGSSWSQLTNMPDSITYFNGESVGNSLYVTGGRSDFQSQGVTYRLTHQSGTWQWNALSSLNVPRGYFGMGQTDGTMMIIGGIQGSGQPPYDINTTMNSPEIFDTNNPQAGWQSVPALPGVTRAAPIVAGVDGKFYVFGGTIFGYMGADSVRLSDAYMYDPATSLWSTLPSIPYGLSGADAVVYQDRYIVMVGGVAQGIPQQPGYYNNKVEVFDTVSRTYSILPSTIPYGANDIRATLVGDKIYAVGGENSTPADSFTTPWYQIGQIQFQPPPPPGNTLFRDGLESGAIEAHPGPAIIGSWAASQNGNSLVQVAGAGGPGPGAAAEGNQYLSLFRAPEPPSSDVVATAQFVSQPTEGTIHAQWQTWIPDTIGDYGMLIGMDSGEFGTFARSAIFTTAGGTNRVLYRRQTGAISAWDLADITFAYNAWQQWEVDWELGSGQLTLTIDGNSQVLNVPDAAGSGLDKFFIRSGNLNQQFAIDGILVELVGIPVPGDFDGDGDVDGADFVVWQTHFPTASGATLADGDADGDGDVDGADFVVWQTNFPFAPSDAVAPVPEPGSWILASLGLIGLRWLRFFSEHPFKPSAPSIVN